MAGIYIHIPFCKQNCTYCNFHFSTSLKYKDRLVSALLREIKLRRDYLSTEDIETIYLGGGTPSLLPVQDLNLIFTAIQDNFKATDVKEYTIECNPDDLSEEYLTDLKKHSPINRLSIGIQSFDEEQLSFMNRAHSAQESRNCLFYASKLGFDNVTIDLIYGIPGFSDLGWVNNLEKFLEYGIPHISCYALTVEKKTVLNKWVKDGKVSMSDDEAVRQFYTTKEILDGHGYHHYEISNYALEDHEAIHNSSYWNGDNYLGIGPSAHSFNGSTRSWNVSNNQKYIKSLEKGELSQTTEILTDADKYNEYLLTNLRRARGVDLASISALGNKFQEYFQAHVTPIMKEGWIRFTNNKYHISNDGLVFTDELTARLFYAESDST